MKKLMSHSNWRKYLLKQKLLLLAVLFLLFGFAGSLQADVITIETISGNWSNPQGGEAVSIVAGATSSDEDTIYWGRTGRRGQQSGYIWDATDTPYDATTDVVFSLGDFTHINQPIRIGTSITSV